MLNINKLLNLIHYRLSDNELRLLILSKVRLSLAYFPKLVYPYSSEEIIRGINLSAAKAQKKDGNINYVIPAVGFSTMIDIFDVLIDYGEVHFKRGISELFERDPQMVHVLSNSMVILSNVKSPIILDSLPLTKRQKLLQILKLKQNIVTLTT